MKSEQTVEMMKIWDDFTNSRYIYLPGSQIYHRGVRRLECLDIQRNAAEAKADAKAKYL